MFNTAISFFSFNTNADIIQQLITFKFLNHFIKCIILQSTYQFINHIRTNCQCNGTSYILNLMENYPTEDYLANDDL